MKKIIWLLVAAMLVGGIVYYKVYYPNSNWQLKNSLKFVESTPVNDFYSTNDISCGIWYRRGLSDSEVTGKQNEDVQKCFLAAVSACEKKNILIVDDQSAKDEKMVKYSFLRVINKNDAGDCLLQNTYEEQKVGEEQKMPISYTNTCTKLEENLMTTCEPVFLEDLRKINEQQ